MSTFKNEKYNLIQRIFKINLRKICLLSYLQIHKIYLFKSTTKFCFPSFYITQCWNKRLNTKRQKMEATLHHGDDDFDDSFDSYTSMYKRLAYNNFPLNYLFYWDNDNNQNDFRLEKRKDFQKLALWKASKNFQKKFDLKRSYRENKGDVQKLENDIVKIFWYFYRQEYPDKHSMKMQPRKFENSCRYNFKIFRNEYISEKRKKERLDKLRGATKRYDKEVEYRNKIGDDEFNRRMKEEKMEKHKKGPNSDKKYLEFILWRKNEMKKPNSIYFNSSVESMNVVKKIYNIGIPSIKNGGTYFLKDEFSECLRHFLTQKDCNVWIEINQSGFGNISMKHAWLNSGFFRMDGSTREQTVSGYVTNYAIHPMKGLLISIDPKYSKMNIFYPQEYRMFQEYRDLESGEYLGIPSDIYSWCHILRTINGNIRFKVTTKHECFTVSNYMLPDSIAKIKNEIVLLTERNGFSISIEERLKTSMNRKHETNEMNGKKIQELVKKKVSKLSGNNTEQLSTIVSMFEKGLLTTEEFSAAKKKILHPI